MPDLGNSSVFSQTDGSNNSGTMPSWSGSAAPSTLDDAGRAFQGAVTREWNWRNFTLTAGGTAAAKTLTYSVAPAAYYNGQRFAFIANTTNTGSATLNVNSLGAKTIKKDVSGTLTNLSASDMVSGMFVEVAYNTSDDCFVWVNRGATITGAANTWSAVQTFTASPVISVTDNTNAALRVTQLGTGPAFRVEDSANPDASPFIVDASGNVGIGTTTVNGLVNINGITPVISFYNNSIYNADIGLGVFTGFGDTFGINARGAAGILTFGTNNTERMRIDSSGNVLVTGAGGLGYGTGSGGTVTQLTSKSTGVTLNKTNGQIISHNAALGASSEVAFTVTNSTVAATDVIILSKASGGASAKYDLYVGAVAAGSFDVVIRNVTAASGSDAITINFAVIKAVTS